MKNLFVWNTFMQWKPVAIKEQKVTENQAGSDDATTDVNQQTAGVQIADQANQGLSYEERWKIIQYFSDWIKNADVRIQMLLAVQGFIVAAYWSTYPGHRESRQLLEFVDHSIYSPLHCFCTYLFHNRVSTVP